MQQLRFKETMSFDDRRAWFLSLVSKHENKIPVVVETDPRSTIKFFSFKLTLKPTVQISMLAKIVRDKIQLSNSEAIFLFCGNVSLAGNKVLGETYEKYRDKDGFLYIVVSNIESFGTN